jgi:cyclohexyl-isocyanide hydratase
MGGGVTAGIDFAFAVVRDVWGEEEAQAIQLKLEYFPALPPGLLTARPEVVREEGGKGARVLDRVEAEGKGLKEERKEVCARVKARLDGKK